MNVMQLNREPSTLYPDQSAAAIDLRIHSVRAEIVTAEATIALLEADGHVVTDATAHLRGLLVTLAGLLNAKTAAH